MGRIIRQTEGVIKLVLSDPSFEEFRCECGALLLRGRHLEKALFEIKCKRCGAFVTSEGALVVNAEHGL